MRLRIMLATILSLVGSPTLADDDSTSTQTSAQASAPWLQLPELTRKTMGGRQFWTDVVIHHAWRIQENVYTGHFRLLDEQDTRHASGTHTTCMQSLQKLKQANNVPDLSGEVVIVAHGLGGHRSVMADLANYVEREGDYTVLNFGYASTRAGIETHATKLASVINHLGEDVQRVHFVAHSLGNLVVRRYLSTLPLDENPATEIGRFVMLAPPNQGAAMARLLHHSQLFHLFVGGSGQQLASKQLHALLGVPKCDFGIIAGGKRDGAGWNPALSGDDDLLVRVAETDLAGAKARILLRVRHKEMLRDKTAWKQTLHFLKHGRFQATDSPETLRTP